MKGHYRKIEISQIAGEGVACILERSTSSKILDLSSATKVWNGPQLAQGNQGSDGMPDGITPENKANLLKNHYFHTKIIGLAKNTTNIKQLFTKISKSIKIVIYHANPDWCRFVL